ncbi:HEAT repeat domain-containing protein [Sphingopyxis sp.]|uniref:HEAT repeat domain-containing protein n=1 Tax=Sphingopyxis sp. TaxID=1908224 RepID=UPI003D0BF419
MPSRHDHFPRHDRERCFRTRAAADALETGWRAADVSPQGLVAAIDALRDAPPAVAMDRLLPWLRDISWLRARLERALALVEADIFARPPLRPIGGGERIAGLILAECGPVRLSLQLHRVEQGGAASTAAVFTPGAAVIRVLASGGAMLHRHHVALSEAEATGLFSAASAALCHNAPPRPLAQDEILQLDTAREAFSLTDAKGDVVLLELAVQPPSSLPIRSYDIASGRLAHVSASRRDSSFRQMALTLLRSFGRTDAAPLFVEATHDADFATRWSALRELVALDPAAARARVEAMAASDPHPEIRRAATATLALYAPKEADPCPA